MRDRRCKRGRQGERKHKKKENETTKKGRKEVSRKDGERKKVNDRQCEIGRERKGNSVRKNETKKEWEAKEGE